MKLIFATISFSFMILLISSCLNVNQSSVDKELKEIKSDTNLACDICRLVNRTAYHDISIATKLATYDTINFKKFRDSMNNYIDSIIPVLITKVNLFDKSLQSDSLSLVIDKAIEICNNCADTNFKRYIDVHM